jgi:hypothetical protein
MHETGIIDDTRIINITEANLNHLPKTHPSIPPFVFHFEVEDKRLKAESSKVSPAYPCLPLSAGREGRSLRSNAPGREIRYPSISVSSPLRRRGDVSHRSL